MECARHGDVTSRCQSTRLACGQLALVRRSRRVTRKATPCHFVTVFIPLFKSSLPIGPTEMVPGTHLLTSEMPNATIPDQYPSLETVERLTNVASAKRDGYRSCFLDFSPGDIIVMDGRMLHRGLDNNLARRHLIYMSFCRPWYYEWPRSHSDHASLFKNSKL